MIDSEITYTPKGEASSFVGKDAVELFRAATLASTLMLYKAGMVGGRKMMTGPQALKAVTAYTGQVYKRGEYDRAKADLKVWIETMKSTIPTRTLES